MSKVLYRTDYISIMGDIQDKKVFGTDKVEKYLLLFFTIQINGKLKTFHHYFELSEDYEGLGLKDYKQWYILYETLGELGYTIGDYGNPAGGNIIDKWIEQSQENLTDVFLSNI